MGIYFKFWADRNLPPKRPIRLILFQQSDGIHFSTFCENATGVVGDHDRWFAGAATNVSDAAATFMVRV